MCGSLFGMTETYLFCFFFSPIVLLVSFWPEPSSRLPANQTHSLWYAIKSCQRYARRSGPRNWSMFNQRNQRNYETSIHFKTIFHLRDHISPRFLHCSQSFVCIFLFQSKPTTCWIWLNNIEVLISLLERTTLQISRNALRKGSRSWCSRPAFINTKKPDQKA